MHVALKTIADAQIIDKALREMGCTSDLGERLRVRVCARSNNTVLRMQTYAKKLRLPLRNYAQLAGRVALTVDQRGGQFTYGAAHTFASVKTLVVAPMEKGVTLVDTAWGKAESIEESLDFLYTYLPSADAASLNERISWMVRARNQIDPALLMDVVGVRNTWAEIQGSFVVGITYEDALALHRDAPADEIYKIKLFQEWWISASTWPAGQTYWYSYDKVDGRYRWRGDSRS